MLCPRPLPRGVRTVPRLPSRIGSIFLMSALAAALFAGGLAMPPSDGGGKPAAPADHHVG